MQKREQGSSQPLHFAFPGFMVLSAVMFLHLLAGPSSCPAAPPGSQETGSVPSSGAGGRSPGGKGKVFYLDSYHAEYLPSVLSQRGARDILEPAGVEMEVFYLDAKRNDSDEALRQTALQARRRIQEWKPDLIIAADDPASQYVIVPYYKNTDLPVVFIGINWDAGKYGFPCRNVTGQVEVEVVRELLAELRKYARGGRSGLLTGDTTTDRDNLKYYREDLGIRFDAVRLVDTFEAWKKAYLVFQKDVDLLLTRNNAGIDGWDDAQAEAFITDNARIVSGSDSPNMSRFVVMNFSKVREEFGEWSARTALRILAGAKPSNIPLTTNKQARIYLNMKLAKRLGIKFPMELIERATFVEEKIP